MNGFWIRAAVVVVALGVVACGQPSHEDVVKEMIATMEGVSETLDGVTDKASAEAAASEIEGYLDDLTALAEDAKDMEDPPQEEMTRIMDEYGEKLMTSGRELRQALQKALANPEAAEVLKPLLEELQKKMQDMN